MGTGAAIVAAYVLAGELKLADGNYRLAFERYEARLRRFANRCQIGGRRAGKFLALRTRFGAEFRTLGTGPLLRLFLKTGEDISAAVELPQYPVPT